MVYVYPVLTDNVYSYPALKASLRSLVHQEYPDILIIGGRPDWLSTTSPKVSYIAFDPRDRNSYLNVVKKIDVACEFLDEFILMNDDQIFLEHINFNPNKMYARDWVYLKERFKPFNKITSKFRKSLWNVHQEFKDAIDYDTHFPCYINAGNWTRLWEYFDKKANLQYKSLYGNFYGLEPIYTKDCKALDLDALEEWHLSMISTSNNYERTKKFRNSFRKLVKSPYEK